MNVNEYISEMTRIYGKNEDRRVFFREEGRMDILFHMSEDKELKKGIVEIGGKNEVYEKIVNSFSV